MPTAGVTHDITISCANGSNKRGFMLLADRKDLRRFGLQDAQTIQERVLGMGALTEQEADPRFQGFWTQGCFRAGIGGVRFTDAPQSLAISAKVDTSVDGKIKLAPELFTTTVDCAPTSYKPSGFATVGTEVWSFVGRNTYQWNYACADWDIGNTPQASDVVYRNGVELGGKTFVPAWNAACSCRPAPYIYKADGDCNWTLIAGCAPHSFKYFAKSRNANGCEILIGGYEGCNKHHIRTSTDPTNTANWSTPTAVGCSDSEITALIEANENAVLVLKTNGVWSFPRSGIVENLTPEFESRAHPDNFRGAHNWNGHILLPLGGGGMMALIGERLYNVSLRTYAPEQTQLHGRVAAIHGNPNNLFILVHDPDNTRYHLLMAEWTQVETNQTDYHWHHLGEVAYTTGTVASHSALFSEGIPGPCSQIHNRTWLAVESAGSNLLPHFSALRTDAQYGFTNDCDALAQTVADCRNFRRVCKRYATLDLVHNNLGAGGRQITVDYRVDSGSWQTDLNNGCCTNVVTSTAKTSSLTFPPGTTGKILELRFKPAQTSVSGTSPELEKFTVTSQLRPDPLKLLPVNIYLADNQLTLNGATESRVKGALAQLRAWNGQASEVTVTDAEGTSKSMVFLPGTFKANEIRKEHGRRSEWAVSTLLVEV